jgi:hypothetical protein
MIVFDVLLHFSIDSVWREGLHAGNDGDDVLPQQVFRRSGEIRLLPVNIIKSKSTFRGNFVYTVHKGSFLKFWTKITAGKLSGNWCLKSAPEVKLLPKLHKCDIEYTYMFYIDRVGWIAPPT